MAHRRSRHPPFPALQFSHYRFRCNVERGVLHSATEPDRPRIEADSRSVAAVSGGCSIRRLWVVAVDVVRAMTCPGRTSKQTTLCRPSVRQALVKPASSLPKRTAAAGTLHAGRHNHQHHDKEHDVILRRRLDHHIGNDHEQHRQVELCDAQDFARLLNGRRRGAVLGDQSGDLVGARLQDCDASGEGGEEFRRGR